MRDSGVLDEVVAVGMEKSRLLIKLSLASPSRYRWASSILSLKTIRLSVVIFNVTSYNCLLACLFLHQTVISLR